MAGDWIKMETSLSEKPEVISIANELQIDRFAVVGRLHKLWCWFDAHSEDGHAKGVTIEFIDEVVLLIGFAAALRKVDWLEVRSGSLSIPHFSRHNGQSAKKRAQAKDRQQKSRSSGKRSESKSRESISPSQQASHHQVCHGPSVTNVLPEKRREEKRNEPLKSPKLGGGDPGLVKAVAGVQSLQAEWSGRLTQPEMVAIYRELAVFSDYPWELVRDWLASEPEKPPSNRLEFLETGGVSTRSRAMKWQGKKAPGHKQTTPRWLPDDWQIIATKISGIDCSHYADYRAWCEAHPLDRGDLESQCRKKLEQG